jgi:hypothetical protein
VTLVTGMSLAVEMPRHLPQVPNRSFEPSPHYTSPLPTTRLISPAFSS